MSIKSDKWIKRQSMKPTHVDSAGNFYHHNLDKDTPDFKLGINSGMIKELKSDTLFQPMIEPFHDRLIRKRSVKRIGMEDGEREEVDVISYGVSSYGYDVQVGSQFKIFTNINSTIVDPKNFDDKCYVDVDGSEAGYVIIPPNGFALANTLPYFRIPRDVLVICLGKSTYARCGIIVNVTPLEPEWEGQVVLEFSNTTSLPAKIYCGEGVAQFLFLQADEDDVCEISYADRGGKYQGQTGITLPKA